VNIINFACNTVLLNLLAVSSFFFYYFIQRGIEKLFIILIIILKLAYTNSIRYAPYQVFLLFKIVAYLFLKWKYSIRHFSFLKPLCLTSSFHLFFLFFIFLRFKIFKTIHIIEWRKKLNLFTILNLFVIFLNFNLSIIFFLVNFTINNLIFGIKRIDLMVRNTFLVKIFAF